MHELLPFEAYDEAGALPVGVAARTMGVFIGLPLALILWLFGVGDGNPVVLVVACVALGAALGWIWARWLRRAITGFSTRAYAGDPEMVPSPPPGDYRFRVMSALIHGKTGKQGHLYVAHDRWVFVPYRFPLPPDRTPLAFEPPVDVGPAPVAVVPDTRPRRFKRSRRRSPFIVQFDHPAGPFLLKVPQPDVVVARMTEVSGESVAAARGT